MGIGYAIGNVILATREYQNLPEVIVSIVKRQEPGKVILKNGLTIEASVGLRFLVREIFFEKIYNPAHLTIEKNDIVVDIGANCGVFTLFAAYISKNKVHAFEPSPKNFAILQRNITVNRLEHVVAHNCAVSDKIGLTKMLLNPLDGQQNLLSEYIQPDRVAKYQTRSDLNYLTPPQKEARYIEVPTTTLQDIMDSNHLERIDFLKLDCEGAEGPILSTTPGNYLKRIRKIAMEFHDHLSQFHHNDIQKLLKEGGFATRLQWDRKSPLGYIYAWRD